VLLAPVLVAQTATPPLAAFEADQNVFGLLDGALDAAKALSKFKVRHGGVTREGAGRAQRQRCTVSSSARSQREDLACLPFVPWALAGLCVYAGPGQRRVHGNAVYSTRRSRRHVVRA
jgi:hypothetical protein